MDFRSILFLVFCEVVLCQVDIGDLCDTSEYGVMGVYQELKKCRSVEKYIKINGKYPPPKGYTTNDAIICCTLDLGDSCSDTNRGDGFGRIKLLRKCSTRANSVVYGYAENDELVCCNIDNTKKPTLLGGMGERNNDSTSTTVDPPILARYVDNIGPRSKQNIRDDCNQFPNGEGKCSVVSKCESAELLGSTNLYCADNVSEIIVCCPDAIKYRPPTFTSISKAKCYDHLKLHLSESLLANIDSAYGVYDRQLHPNGTYTEVYAPLYFIFNGDLLAYDEAPYMAALGFGITDISWECGGSLISENFVLTAAHCLFSRDSGAVTWARLGTADLNDNTTFNYRVANVFRHPEYRSALVYHDIGLLKLEKKVPISGQLYPVCLDTQKYIDPGSELRANGWGKQSFTGDSSTQLMTADLTIHSYERCRKFFSNLRNRRLSQGINDESQICAGGISDTCQGDSGGPLEIKRITEKTSYFSVVGITSFGKACGIDNASAVYTKVSYYLPWIESIVWPEEAIFTQKNTF